MSPPAAPNSPSRTRQAATAAVILAIGAGAALAIRYSGERTTTTLDKISHGGPPVVAATAREVPLRAPAVFAGRLEARRAVDLAPEIAGRLLDLDADVGDVLKAGQAAFRLDDRDARLAVENRRAQLVAAEARGRQAARRAERRSRLGDEGISASEVVEQAQLDLEVAEADQVVARQQLRLAEREREKTTVTAPWTGTVTERHADPGAWLVPGQAVLRLVDLSQVDVRVDVPAADAVHLRPGDAVRVRFASVPGRVWDGRVRFVADEAGDGDLQFPVAIELPGDELLAAGMVAEVEFDFGRAGPGVAVPLDALDRDGDGPFVWIVDGGRLRRQPVVVAGARAGEAILANGIVEGDRVVVSATAQLADGLEVGEVSEASRR